MRYLVHCNFIRELSARKKYLEDSIRLWFYTNQRIGEFVQLSSMPNTALSDYLIIVGHNQEVKNFLSNEEIEENNIIAITCNLDKKIIKRKLLNKNLYISKQRNSRSELFRGYLYGFDFDLTESEIIFYNSPKQVSFKERIKSSFSSF